MSEKVRFGIMGCGPRGMQMARIAKLLPDCCLLTAMSDPDENALAKAGEAFPEIKLFRSSDELLDSKLVDAVITEIPPAVHTEYVGKALDRGIHVLGEIPCVDSLEEADFLWRKVNASKALYMCGSNPNYRAKTQLILKLRDMGLLGRIAYIETEYVHGTGDPVQKESWRNAYESCRYCTHSLGPVLALTGEDFTAVSCMSTYDRLNNGRAHNAMASLLHTKDNLVVRFLAAFGVPTYGPQHTTRIFAEKAHVLLYNQKARIWFKGLNEYSAGNDWLEIPLTPEGSSRPAGLPILDEEIFRAAHYGHNGSDNLMLRDFAEAILNGKPSPLGIREGLAMTLPGIYAAQSARLDGQRVSIHYPWEKEFSADIVSIEHNIPGKKQA
ncbi:MAG: Gfo/Idh/MocA family oxidoreductase [Lentisphaeria bacterium]|nr:Gfo/Idh/MocA family oxidoreductase [Lentisphaeria bacterium]